MTPPILFPAALQPFAPALLQALSGSPDDFPRQGSHVHVQGEPLFIPYRLCVSENNLWRLIDAATGDRRTLALCFGTRHNEGRAREDCLRALLGTDAAWAIPFVVRLLGEYVIEIVEVVAAALPSMNAAHIAAFVRENPAFMATTRRQASSYWNCYYRHKSKLKRYPAIQVLDAMALLASHGGT